MTTAAIVITLAVAFGAAALQTATGFGFALLSTPILATAMQPKVAVAVTTLVAAPLGWIRYRQERHDIDRPMARRLTLSAFVGMPLGLVVQHALAPNSMRLAIGSVVIVLAIAIAAGWRLRNPSARSDAALGVVSGLLSTSTGTNGPPLVVAIDSRHAPPNVFRATLVGIFVPTGLVTLVLFAATGTITRRAIGLSALGFPAMLAGNQVGRLIAPRLSAATFRRLMLALLFISGVAAIGKARGWI
jgi:uncharacterized membrane protein YfcA